MVIGQLAKNGGGNTRPVRQTNNRDLGLVRAVRNTADCFLFHDCILIHNESTRSVGKTRPHLKVYIMPHGHGD